MRIWEFWRLNYSCDGSGYMALCSGYASGDVGCRNSSLGDKTFRFTSLSSVQITVTQSYVPVYLRSSTVHAELSSLYIKVIILALVILFPWVIFSSVIFTWMIAAVRPKLQPGNLRSSWLFPSALNISSFVAALIVLWLEWERYLGDSNTSLTGIILNFPAQFQCLFWPLVNHIITTGQLFQHSVLRWVESPIVWLSTPENEQEKMWFTIVNLLSKVTLKLTLKKHWRRKIVQLWLYSSRHIWNSVSSSIDELVNLTFIDGWLIQAFSMGCGDF